MKAKQKIIYISNLNLKINGKINKNGNKKIKIQKLNQ